MPTFKIPCPRCGGFIDYDDNGGRYSCYQCCDTGYVQATMAEYVRHRLDCDLAWDVMVFQQECRNKVAILKAEIRNRVAACGVAPIEEIPF